MSEVIAKQMYGIVCMIWLLTEWGSHVQTTLRFPAWRGGSIDSTAKAAF